MFLINYFSGSLSFDLFPFQALGLDYTNCFQGTLCWGCRVRREPYLLEQWNNSTSIVSIVKHLLVIAYIRGNNVVYMSPIQNSHQWELTENGNVHVA